MSENVTLKKHKTLKERFYEVEKWKTDLKKSKRGKFCLFVIDHLPIWNKKTPMGKTTIDIMIKKMKENSPLKDVYSEAVTNHSAKKTGEKEFW